jgi:hypothetical protein
MNHSHVHLVLLMIVPNQFKLLIAKIVLLDYTVHYGVPNLLTMCKSKFNFKIWNL